MPFREAHHVTGRIVGLASARGVALEELTLEEMQSVEPRIDAAALDVLGVENSVKSRTSYGGTAPDNVRAQAEGWLGGLPMFEARRRIAAAALLLGVAATSPAHPRSQLDLDQAAGPKVQSGGQGVEPRLCGQAPSIKSRPPARKRLIAEAVTDASWLS